MNRDVMPSQQKVSNSIYVNERNDSTLFADLKALFKAPVLLANVLPVFTGFWLALYFTDASFVDNLSVFLFTMLGSTMVMAGALILNNWYDVDIDTIMERTKKRPTVTGNIPLNVVLMMGVILSILGFALLLFATIEAVVWAFIGWFTYVFLYTMWSKRRYTLNTVIGSVSGAVSPLIGWTAINPEYHIVPMMLFLILFIWQMPHTFAISIKKYKEYKAAGVKMLPVVHGIDITKRQMFVYAVCLLPLPIYLASLGTVFLIIATILNIGWIIVSARGFFAKDTMKWADMVFLYSVNYITIIFLLMVVVTLPF